MFSALLGVLHTPWAFIYILEVLVEFKKKIHTLVLGMYFDRRSMLSSKDTFVLGVYFDRRSMLLSKGITKK